MGAETGPSPRLPRGKAGRMPEARPEGVALRRARDEGRRTSLYLTMRDGVRIAVDVTLPTRLSPGERVPAILRQTRYYRSVELLRGFDRRWARDLFDLSAPTRERFLSRGYAWVDVDVRGSGVSGGSWPVPWSPEEVADGAEVVDFVVKQPWSNGRVGSTGISYEGTTADMLLVNRHEAVKAIAPRFSLLDAYEDIAKPGGVQLSWFTDGWSTFNRLLDDHRYHEAMAGLVGIVVSSQARAPGMERLAGLVDALGPVRTKRLISLGFGLFFRGGRRVDEDPDGSLRSALLLDHEKNGDVHDLVGRGDFKDDPYPERADLGFDVVSPRAHLDAIRSTGAAIFSYGGWFDGGYAHAALERFVNAGGAGSRLSIGPWGHAGVLTHRAFAEAKPSTFDHDSELLAFFDGHLWPNREPAEAPRVKYYVFGHETWKEATAWPPPGNTARTLFLGGGRKLVDAPEAGADTVTVDRTIGTGERSRWRGLLAGFVAADYPGLGARLKTCVSFDSAAFERDLEVTGHPVAHLWVRTDAVDGTFFVYLLDVAPDGRVAYVTEGQLRAVHRKLVSPPSGFVALRPYRAYTHAEALPLEPGVPAELTIGLLPAAHAFLRGHRARVVITATDRDHFAPPPDTFRGFEVLRGDATPSRVVVPVRPG